MATGDTEFLRLTLAIARQLDLSPVRLVHALQSHDEMTYELVHFAATHQNDVFHFRGGEVRGGELAVIVRGELIERLTGPAAPYNSIFTTNGIASTTATIIAASLGHRDITDLTPVQIERIKQAHLLLAMFNAWQPGVFALSGWDLCGMLTLPRDTIPELLSTGDTRWTHRAAYDLMNYRPEATASPSAIPKGTSLYGPLPQQLQDPTSFASGLHRILAVRAHYRIATSVQVDVPDVFDKALLVMVHELDTARIQATVLNFAHRSVTGRVRSDHLPAGATVTDMITDETIAVVDRDRGFPIMLEPHQGRSLLIAPAPSS
jgi:trehalose synthase